MVVSFIKDAEKMCLWRHKIHTLKKKGFAYYLLLVNLLLSKNQGEQLNALIA